MSEAQIPAGWYPDPLGDTTKVRYWDGLAWTSQLLDVTNPYGSAAPYTPQPAATPPFQPAQTDFNPGEVYQTPAPSSSEQPAAQPYQPPYQQQPTEQPWQQTTAQPYQQQLWQQPAASPWQQQPLTEPDRSGLWLGIGIASVLLLTWPLAIPQIISASGAGKAYRSGDAATYRTKLKTSRICFIVNLCLMAALVSCLIAFYLL
ncbi:MAG: DUF2510 domain-containing protein [Coriobacteriales bacterium]|jgi:hypothetical protein|nr:DUF2510 domain-containing protein [Coriobacteriales bacterium]